MNSTIRKIIVALIISTFCSGISTKIAPDYIQICPGLKSDCLKDNIQRTLPHFVKGIPSIGLNSTDPLHINYITFDLPGGLKIEFSDGIITGLRKCVVDSVKYENAEVDLKFHCDFLIKGKYKAYGKILLFTLDGDGDVKIKAKNVAVQSKIYFEDKVRNGVVYSEVKNIKLDYRFDDKVTFVLTNLFKGNPELSQTILTFLNENWKQVVDEFGKPIISPVLDSTIEELKKFFKNIPKEELMS